MNSDTSVVRSIVPHREFNPTDNDGIDTVITQARDPLLTWARTSFAIMVGDQFSRSELWHSGEPRDIDLDKTADKW
jgi:hypothetical protein